MKGAQIVVEILKEQGIDTLFGYPGGMILPLYDALYDEKNINQIWLNFFAIWSLSQANPAKKETLS